MPGDSRKRDPRASRARKTGDAAPTDADPLGKLVQQHGVTLAGVLIVSGAVCLIGIGIAGWTWLRPRASPWLLLIGAGVVVFGLVLLCLNVVNIGRRLEVRKRGLRYFEAGGVTELLWDDIVDVEISRTDNTYLGVASVRTRSSDAVSPSGLLTKSEFDVTIHGRDGERIRLRPLFLRNVSDPKKLIQEMRMRARLG